MAGFTSEMYVEVMDILIFSDETTSTNGIQNGQVILYNYGSGGTVPAIRIMGKNYHETNAPTVDRHNDWEIKSYSSGSDRRLGFCFLYGGSVQPRGWISSVGGDFVMNFTGQHRTFIKNISHKQVDLYEGLIVCANTDTYIDMKTKTPTYGKEAVVINDGLPSSISKSRI